MDEFYNKIKEISEKNKKVAMFIDMDGTIVEFKVYTEDIGVKDTGKFINGKPLKVIIDKLEKISKLPNVDLYILSLARSYIVVDEKKVWLKKNVPFIDEKNWIIINKENGDYSADNREIIKTEKMKEKSNDYDYFIFLDDDHKILKRAKVELGDKIDVYHISSALV